MSVFPAPPAARPEVGEDEYAPAGDLDAPARTPVLITEQEVAFSTSAAVSLPRTKSTRQLTAAVRVVAGALRRVFLAPATSPRPRRHFPPRYSYLENAIMAREMHRL